MNLDRPPELPLDWEEALFKAAARLWRRLFPASAPKAVDPARAALLVDHHAALEALAGVVAGRPLRIVPHPHVVGLRGDDLLLPPALDIAPTPAANRELYALAAALLATTRGEDAHLRSPADEADAIEAAHRALDTLAAWLPGLPDAFARGAAHLLASRPDPDTLRGAARRAELARQRVLRGAWPDDLDALRAELHDPREAASPAVLLWGRLLACDARPDDACANTEGQLATPRGREATARPVAEIERRVLKEDPEQWNIITHSFEKIEHLDNATSNAGRVTDGSDELDEHLDALDEIDLRELVRGGDPAEALLRADLDLPGEIPDVERIAPGEGGLPYDEWDGRTRTWRRAWCTVYPTRLPRGDDAWAAQTLRRHRRLIDDLHRRLLLHRASRQPIGRQRDGDDIDLDAVVDEIASRRAGAGGGDRLYLRAEPRRRRFATTVLLDISLSTDAWIEDRRVLDIAREAVLVLGEVTDRLGDDLQILAFASKTRNACRVFSVRGFGEPWALGRSRLGALTPQGYTRVGPALRHATSLLAQHPADRRLLLLVSDGKPTDYDRYEGRYGMADVRMALREAEALGICSRALTIDLRARASLPLTFGPGAWHVIPHPDALTAAMTEIWGRLAQA